jgi:hypothetical protein
MSHISSNFFLSDLLGALRNGISLVLIHSTLKRMITASFVTTSGTKERKEKRDFFWDSANATQGAIAGVSAKTRPY